VAKALLQGEGAQSVRGARAGFLWEGSSDPDTAGDQISPVAPHVLTEYHPEPFGP